MSTDGEPSAVRPYLLTGGRTRASEVDLPIETVVESVVGAHTKLRPEYRRMATMAKEAHSIAELSVKLGIPIGVARVLASDMVALRHLRVVTDEEQDAEASLLQQLIDGLRSL